MKFLKFLRIFLIPIDVIVLLLAEVTYPTLYKRFIEYRSGLFEGFFVGKTQF